MDKRRRPSVRPSKKLKSARRSSPPTLEDLVKRIDKKNRHKEVDFGPPVGKEVF